jgi:hypothetical protein
VTADYEQWPDPQVSIGSKAEGYPCPKDGAALTLIETDNGVPGAWCPTCHTTWLQTDEVSMKDLDDA